MTKEANDVRGVRHEALASYASFLTFLTASGQTGRQASAVELPFLRSVPGLERLLLSLGAVAPATPGASDEEWNPLSQRPHAPLPPAVGDELGGEITALKEAVDAFTTLAHEAMHVALWEPYFVGRWRPRGKRHFREFSLMAEGYCFFFGDIVVSGAVRVRLPDGEFALERETPSNARFSPVRAFQSLGIENVDAIRDIYLEGFSGRPTALWRPRGESNFAASTAAHVYNFYAGSLGYLDELYDALAAFGGLSEFYRRFCAIPGLPTFIDGIDAPADDLRAYFVAFSKAGLKNLEKAPVESIRWRRMLQTRAYFALQVRWLLSEGLVVGRSLTPLRRRRLAEQVELYLKGLRSLLLALARDNGASPLPALAELDASYETGVRTPLVAHDVWAGHRWLIAPRRAGGAVSAFDSATSPVDLLRTVAFIVDELTRAMKASNTLELRAEILASIERIAAIGVAGGSGDAKAFRAAARRMRAALASSAVLPLWSLPLAHFEPIANRHRELCFSYQ